MSGKTFTWLGGWGYRQTGVEWSSVYVRARHYSPGLSNWTSVDPLWPAEMPYGYVEGRVMTASDPSGMKPMSSPYTGGLNYGCNSYPCCGSNTWYWQNECEKTGRRFECCAARVSKGICTTVHLAKFNCDTYGCFDVLPGSGLDKYFRWRMSCQLWSKVDCQNSCMRYQHQIKRHSSWSWASRVCRRYGPQSQRCCEASFRVEQKEYEFCARNCFGSLNAIPYDLRIGMGLQGLECCKEKSRRKPWNQSR